MLFAGVELGGTKCVAILARDPNDVVAREIVRTTSPDETLGFLEQILREWSTSHDLSGLGIASFGPIDVIPGSATYGHMLATPKPGWPGADIASRLQCAAGVPATKVSFARDTFTFNFPGTPSEFVDEFRKYYGPTMNAFEAAEKNGRGADLQKELEELFNRQNKGTGVTSIPATFLRVTVAV